jgi:hypothetical protein
MEERQRGIELWASKSYTTFGCRESGEEFGIGNHYPEFQRLDG